MALQAANVPELFTLEKWGGVNQQNERGTIGDQELFWCENLFPVGDGNLRSMWGPSAPLYQAPSGTTILRIFFGFYGNDLGQWTYPPPGRKGWMFLSDGNVDEVDLDTQAVTRVGKIWEPIPPQYWAAAKVWRPRYVGQQEGEVGGVLFGSPLGLYAWDGANLYSPGDIAPNWLSNDNIFLPPTPTIMPVGLTNIYAMEVYQERLWIAGRSDIQFSVPQNGADFAASDGGGSFGYFGDKLVHDYMDLGSSSGYLFVFGDSSTDVIANVQLAGAGTETNPFITNFNYSNVDPITGQRFPRPTGRWGRYFLLFNGAGLFEMQGGDAQSRGEKMLKIWDTVDFPIDASQPDTTQHFYPTMCAATMFGKRIMLVNGKFTDPWGVTRSMMLVWDGSKWWTASQAYDFSGGKSQYLNLTHIGSYEDNSVITPYGTDGQYLFRLFDHPDQKLLKRLSTKAERGTGQSLLTIKNFRYIFAEMYDNYGEGVSVTGTFTTTGGNVVNGTEPLSFQLTGGPGTQIRPSLNASGSRPYDIQPNAISGAGIAIQLDLQSYSPDFTIERLHFMGEQRSPYWA